MQGVPQRRLPEAVLRWRDPTANENDLRLEPGYDVILATVELDQGKVDSVSPLGRRSAVPLKRPYIAAGRSDRDSMYTLQVDQNARIVTVILTIDTSQAGFVSIPTYHIQVEMRDQSVRPDKISDKEWKLIEQPWNTLLHTFYQSLVDCVPVAESAAAYVKVQVRILLTQNVDSARELLKCLAKRQVDKSDACGREVSQLKKYFLQLLPYQFSWVGVEI
jgi:hypothetical protein